MKNNFERHFNPWFRLGWLGAFNDGHDSYLLWGTTQLKTFIKKPDRRAVMDNLELKEWIEDYVRRTEKALPLPF